MVHPLDTARAYLLADADLFEQWANRHRAEADRLARQLPELGITDPADARRSAGAQQREIADMLARLAEQRRDAADQLERMEAQHAGTVTP